MYGRRFNPQLYRHYNPYYLKKNIIGSIIANIVMFIIAVAVTVLLIALGVYAWYVMVIVWLVFFITLISTIVSNDHLLH